MKNIEVRNSIPKLTFPIDRIKQNDLRSGLTDRRLLPDRRNRITDLKTDHSIEHKIHLDRRSEPKDRRTRPDRRCSINDAVADFRLQYTKVQR